MADEAQASTSSACAVALFVPTSSVQFGPDILEDEIPLAFRATQPRRPHPGGLDTLPEASHVNALSQATGPSPTSLHAAMAKASLGNASNADSILSQAVASLAPPSRSRAITRAKGYNGIAVLLANERWRERWNMMCLAPSEGSAHTSNGDRDGVFSSVREDTSYQFNGAGGHIRGEGGGEMSKMTRSSSRRKVYETKSDDSRPTPASPKLRTIGEMSHNDLTQQERAQQEAEIWRKTPSFRPGELNLIRYEDSEGVIAVVSPWLELDSTDEGIRLDSELALRQELAYASHIGVTSVIVPPPSSDPARRVYLADYARTIAGCLVPRGSEAPAAGHFTRLIIRLPVSSPYQNAQSFLQPGGTRPLSIASNSSNGTAQLRADDDWSWQTWHVVQNVCNYNARLSVALDLSASLPSPATLQRWLAEPVSHVWLPTRTFLANAKGYPVLSKAIQTFLRSLTSVKAPSLCFVLVGTQAAPENHTRGGQAAYEQYIRHMEKSVTSSMTEDDIQLRAYADYLQAPLQPLFDNLEGQTYATFEADLIKYEKYEEAVYQALLTLSSKQIVHVWVCGAGRGPLVSRCIEAARRSGRRLQIVALEKNPNAIVGLRERASNEWGQDVVRVEIGDMRSIDVPKEKADMIVSELLGSFGDNELSPECLDGALRLLKPNGICIPQAYSSFITPISTPKLFGEVSRGTPVTNGSDISGHHGGGITDRRLKATETPYVVLLRSVTHIAGIGGRGDWPDVQHCWTFDHSARANVPMTHAGLPLTNGHNIRLSTHTFFIPQQAVCHGLAGFFETHLWGNVTLSIHPDPARATCGMMSWFPLYFPFKEPLFLAAESELDVSLWRMTSNDRVWYEWMAQAFVVTLKPTRATSMGLDYGESESQKHQQSSSFASGTNRGQPTSRNGHPRSDASQDGASFLSPHSDAFQNAPNTPKLSDSMPLGGTGEGSNAERILVAMTSLMNPGGRSSSVHL